MDYKYEFYRDVEMRLQENNLNIKCPWMEIDLEVPKNAKPKDAAPYLAHLPVTYLYPKHYDGTIQDIVSMYVGVDVIPMMEFLTKKRVTPYMKSLLKDSSWTYPLEDILLDSPANSKGMISSMTFYSRVREFLSKRDLASEDGNIPAMLSQASNDEQFLDLTAKIVRGNHYVTFRCLDALEPILQSSYPIHDFMRDYIRSEKGHDKILLKALRSIDREPEEVPVSILVIRMMDMLKATASRDMLFPAFCLLLERFENSPFEEKDPLAEYFRNHEKTKVVADCLQTHHKINLEGEHFAVGYELLRFVPWISVDQAILALRASELLSRLSKLELKEMALA